VAGDGWIGQTLQFRANSFRQNQTYSCLRQTYTGEIPAVSGPVPLSSNKEEKTKYRSRQPNSKIAWLFYPETLSNFFKYFLHWTLKCFNFNCN
jgi:hypothetical protein